MGTSVALHVRLEMARISFAMLATHPWFGIGIGRYYNASAPLIASSSLAVYYMRENAHNNYLQILAELGLVGAAAMGWLFWTVAVRLRTAASRTGDPLPLWLAAALVAFLLTALVGHPLLTPEVGLNFWLLLGIAGGLSRTGGNAMSRIGTGCFCVLMLATFPARVKNEIRGLDREHVMYGFGARTPEEGGFTYRTIERRATFFVDRDAISVRIPLRAPSSGVSGRRVTVVGIELDGREADRVTVGPEWTTTTLIMPRARADEKFHKIVLVAAPGENDSLEIRVGPLQINHPQ
jgi:hypothetical protein